MRRRYMRPRGSNVPWKPYDPAWPVRLARLRMPCDVSLPHGLARRALARRKSDRYFHFVGEGHPDPASRDWDFVWTEVLENAGFGPAKGDVAVDVLEGNRVGGI